MRQCEFCSDKIKKENGHFYKDMLYDKIKKRCYFCCLDCMLKFFKVPLDWHR